MEDELFIPPGAHLVESPEELERKRQEYYKQMETITKLRQIQEVSAPSKPREDHLYVPTYDYISPGQNEGEVTLVRGNSKDATYNRPTVVDGLENTVSTALLGADLARTGYRIGAYTIPKLIGKAAGRTNLGRASYLNRSMTEVNPFRKSTYDEYGLDEIPIIFDPSKGDAQNYLDRHLSRLRDRGIDYNDITLYPISKSPIPKDPAKRQAIQDGNNMAAVNSKKTIIVSDDPNKTNNLGFMISHELDHIKNPVYNDLQQSQDFVRKFFDFTDSELKLTQADTPRLKITDAEVLARGSQIKDYLGFTKANQYMTPKQLQQAVKNYPKETGSDNLTKFFSRVKDWEGLTDFINKYSTGIVPISIGYYASENDK